MSRAVDEWVGRNDDTAIPPRVKDRILRRQENDAGEPVCATCGARFDAKNRVIFDHILALINGGANREANVHGIGSRCCNPSKTAQDVAVKSKTASVRKSHFGLKPPSRRPIGDPRFRKKLDGSVVPKCRD